MLVNGSRVHQVFTEGSSGGQRTWHLSGLVEQVVDEVRGRVKIRDQLYHCREFDYISLCVP